jgi:hypothetical protein
MENYIENNKKIFKSCGIPFTQTSDTEILIVTNTTDYLVSLLKIGHNTFFFRVYVTSEKKTEIISKEVFVRKMCRFFKTKFVHWDTKMINAEDNYIKTIPKKIVLGLEYTTIWANPFAKWTLKEIINDEDVILHSKKNNKEVLTKTADLRIWSKTTEKK